MEDCSTGTNTRRGIVNPSSFQPGRLLSLQGKPEPGPGFFIATSIHRSLSEEFPLKYTDTAANQLRLHRSEFGKTGTDQVAIMRGDGSCVT